MRFRLRVFDLKLVIATSVNLTADLQVISQQMERFGKNLDRQSQQDVLEHYRNLKIANGQQATEVSQTVKTVYKIS